MVAAALLIVYVEDYTVVYRYITRTGDVFFSLDFLEKQGPTLSKGPLYLMIDLDRSSNDTTFDVPSTVCFEKIESQKCRHWGVMYPSNLRCTELIADLFSCMFCYVENAARHLQQ